MNFKGCFFVSWNVDIFVNLVFFGEKKKKILTSQRQKIYLLSIYYLEGVIYVVLKIKFSVFSPM